jgi:carbamoyltransferase
MAPTYVLGLGCYYHDASAALIRDGAVVAAAEEERFTRVKHDTSFPENAIRYCLGAEGISMGGVDSVGFYEKPLIKFERALSQHVEYFPKSYRTFLRSMPSWLTERLSVASRLRKTFGYGGDVLYIDHHMAHAASSFLVSPFDRAAVVTSDGVGEWTTTSIGLGEGTDIVLKKHIAFPHSLGLLYSTITAYLGFTVNNSEYKVMGLSAYGDMDPATNEYYARLRRTIDIKDDGSFKMDMGYFTYQYADRMPSERLCELLGGPVRGRESDLTQRHKDVAAAVQLVFEEASERMLAYAHGLTGCDNLVMAGGCALNSVFNGKILRKTPFRGLWIQPAAGDGGGSLGAAAYAYHAIRGNPRAARMEHACLGPGYSDGEVGEFLEARGIRHSVLGVPDELVREAAAAIFSDSVVGWFQGRMEFGPRALGSRSILSNPCNPRMRDILNLKVKHRERFRPFAPAVCADDASRFFECDEPLPEPADYMLMVYPIRREWRGRLPAVTHVDGTGRLQTVRKDRNPAYYSLIKEFGRLSGVPVVVNTSFNIRGEPIVCTPEDAYRCMMGTGIDCLFIGNRLVRRQDNPGDAWDSERLAGD